jgi:PKD repeat protein
LTRVLAGGALALAVTAAQAGDVPRVGDLRPTKIQLGGGTATRMASQTEIRTQDAAFIKVHFDHFDLPKGVALEVSSPDGREVYRYGKERRDAYTVDKALGQDGRNSFSAMSITGPVAVLRLVGTPREPWRAEHGVAVTRYLEGYPADMLPELQRDGLLSSGFAIESICGTDDKRAVACYQSTDPTAFDRSRPVAKLILSGGGSCTAWRVGPDNRLFTNNHCFATQAAVAAAEVWFNYQTTTCGGTQGTVTKVTGATMLATNTTLDYTLFTVNNFASLASFGYLGLDPRVPTTGEEIFIPQHPGGRMKELAVVSDHVGGARCRIDTATQNGNGTGTDAGYRCDTEPGSSGSPVVARSSNKVIALHHLGGCNNSGAHIAKIWPQVSTHFGGVVPGGDNGGGNAAPVANFSFTTSGLTATFADTSTDSDGTIASRSWNFGDGTTSTATNPSRTYAAAGTYNVTLTVTDNGGATNTTTKQVTVGTVQNVLTNGVPVNNLSGATGAELRFTMSVPTGASNLKFTIAGGTGDADLYVRFGAAPTTTTYDCRPYLGGNNETCNITTAQAGTYHVMVRAYSTFSGVSLTGSYAIGQQNYFENLTDYAINDNATVESPITVNRSGNASSALQVGVTIQHTYIGDLKVDLVAPDGSVYTLHNRTGAGTDNIVTTYTVNASSELAQGVWKLRVNDNAAQDTGKIDKWSLQF